MAMPYLLALFSHFRLGWILSLEWLPHGLWCGASPRGRNSLNLWFLVEHSIDHFHQRIEIERFGRIVVAPRSQSSFAGARHRVRCKSNNRNVSSRRIALQLRGYLPATKNR